MKAANLNKSKRTKVAIMGATSHIAKGIIYNFAKCKSFSLYLYTRDRNRVAEFIDSLEEKRDLSFTIIEGYNNFFSDSSYDVIINCIGVGTKKKLNGDYSKYFTVTEEYDNLAISYLLNVCRDALYISFSSGAVYGRLNTPAKEDTENSLTVNHIKPEDYYVIARLNAEAKHRSFSDLNIVDLRVFSYFSRFADISEGYLITDIIESILYNRVLKTDSNNIIRDYIHPEDLFNIILKCIDSGKINTAFDAVSAAAVNKNEILEYFSLQFGLHYETDRIITNESATGIKKVYCSNYNLTSKIGYSSKYGSMDTLRLEAESLLDKFRRR